jgi:hypothetical protein
MTNDLIDNLDVETIKAAKLSKLSKQELQACVKFLLGEVRVRDVEIASLEGVIRKNEDYLALITEEREPDSYEEIYKERFGQYPYPQ